MIKISICFLFLRLFPDEKFRRIVWATQCFNFAVLITFIFVNTLQCRPMSFFWTGWDGEHQGSCFNMNAAAWAHAAIHIALDIWMLVLPASQVWTLNVSLKRKLAILAMFSLGILYVSACVFIPPQKPCGEACSTTHKAGAMLLTMSMTRRSLTIVSIIRLQSLTTYKRSMNPTGKLKNCHQPLSLAQQIASALD